jgi:hypothetical protein
MKAGNRGNREENTNTFPPNQTEMFLLLSAIAMSVFQIARK